MHRTFAKTDLFSHILRIVDLGMKASSSSTRDTVTVQSLRRRMTNEDRTEKRKKRISHWWGNTDTTRVTVCNWARPWRDREDSPEGNQKKKNEKWPKAQKSEQGRTPGYRGSPLRMSPWEGGPKKRTKRRFLAACGLSDFEVQTVPEKESVSARY